MNFKKLILQVYRINILTNSVTIIIVTIGVYDKTNQA